MLSSRTIPITSHLLHGSHFFFFFFFCFFFFFFFFKHRDLRSPREPVPIILLTRSPPLSFQISVQRPVPLFRATLFARCFQVPTPAMSPLLKTFPGPSPPTFLRSHFKLRFGDTQYLPSFYRFPEQNTPIAQPLSGEERSPPLFTQRGIDGVFIRLRRTCRSSELRRFSKVSYPEPPPFIPFPLFQKDPSFSLLVPVSSPHLHLRISSHILPEPGLRG